MENFCTENVTAYIGRVPVVQVHMERRNGSGIAYMHMQALTEVHLYSAALGRSQNFVDWVWPFEATVNESGDRPNEWHGPGIAAVA